MKKAITSSLLVLGIMALLICPFINTAEAKTYKSFGSGRQEIEMEKGEK